MNNKPTFKRFLAYFIDIIVVTIITSLFAQIEVLNPNFEEYEKVYEEYVDYYTEISKSGSAQAMLNDSRAQDITYNLSKLGISVSIINLVVTILYFVVFQYFNKGQTIGKKLCKVKVVSKDDGNPPKFYQVLLRSIIINSIVITLIIILSLAFMKKSVYLNVNQILQFIDMALVFTSIGLIILREEGRGLHDMLANTMVVNENYVLEETNVKEAKVVKSKNKSKKDKE